MTQKYGLFQQMSDVLRIANDMECYDAAAWIQRVFFDNFEISLCKDGCFCATRTVDGKCGKCGVSKPKTS